MKISYTGKVAKLQPIQEKKLESRFTKLGKLLDRRGEKEVRVIFTTERHLTHAEITVNWYDRSIVCIGSDADVFNAVTKAVDKLEKQVLKAQAKWRDTKRTAPKAKTSSAAEAAPETVSEPEAPVHKIYRVNQHAKRKPMTVEEAVLEMDKNRDYMVYRDAETDKLAVLVRRRDGHFDLVES